MIHFFLGTKAQLIKTAPVMLELERRGITYRYIDSSQHGSFSEGLRADFGIREPDCSLGAATDVSTYGSAAGWTGRLFATWLFRAGWIRKQVFGGESGICVVHGDTLSTLIGTAFARRAGLQVAHLESGLRSFRYLDPFPEELIRIYSMRRSAVLFAPDDTSVANLQSMKVGGEIVRTNGNTVRDAVWKALDASRKEESSPYFLATFHRLETLRSRSRMEHMVEALNAAAEIMPVTFVVHTPTARAMQKHGLEDKLAASVTRLPMQPYFSFIRLIHGARAMMSDGGSIQEECAILGKPLLIMRRVTERSDGVNTNARISEFNLDIVREFLSTCSLLAAEPMRYDDSPSVTVADRLLSLEQQAGRPQ